MTQTRRLPYRQRPDLDDEAARVWDVTVKHAGDWIVTPEGGLSGPFNAWLHAPGVGRRLGALGSAVLFGTVLDRRLTELAILTVAGQWKAEFEWWAHARAAREAGLDDEIIDCIARGDTPELTGELRIAYHFVRQLVATGNVEDDVLDAARSTLTERGVVELIALCGFYTTIAHMLNVFDVPVPNGERAQWQ
jgi:4-carboxymuconolactone decarboxylase